MRDRYQQGRAELSRAILDGDGVLDREVRQRAHDGRGEDGPIGDYVATVRDHAYRVHDAMVDAVRAAGLDDAAIFELTVATAVGQATRQHEAALAALEAALAAAPAREVG